MSIILSLGEFVGFFLIVFIAILNHKVVFYSSKIKERLFFNRIFLRQTVARKTVDLLILDLKMSTLVSNILPFLCLLKPLGRV